MGRVKEMYLNFRYKGILAIILIFAIISVILFTERSGIQYNYEKNELDFLPAEKIITKDEAFQMASRDTLLLYSSNSKSSAYAIDEFRTIFKDMKVGYDEVDLSVGVMPDISKYDVVVPVMSDLSPIGESIISLCDWVYSGGNVLLPLSLQKNAYSSVLESKLGIADSSYDNIVVDSIYIADGFMIGGGRGFTFDDPFDSAWSVQVIDSDITVYAHSDDEYKIPLIWESRYGKGKFVVDNFGIYEKVIRGFYVASYSLLQDVCVYPVINGSVFYLDDFPSQIPSGNSSYIKRDYNTSIRDFYVNIWWPDMMNFADKYGIRYTGLAIECYDDAVDGTTGAAPDKGTFLNFGNMLMRQGGEIGYHGYNHQPLCLGNVDYKGYFDYKTWDSYAAMKSAFDELVDFCDELFPKINISIYVPPSNVLSQEGRAFLLNEYPQIKTISGIYFEDAAVEASCVQEYEVSEDGIVDQPRVVSACKLEPFMKLAVISELNYHYINSHFTHPDDALDPERGAELGWEKLSEHFNEYLSWLYNSAPNIRNFTGSEMSAAVQRYAAITVDKEISKDKVTFNIGNFYDNAQLMVRFNKNLPSKVSGGKITHITGNLYIIEAESDTVTVLLDKE